MKKSIADLVDELSIVNGKLYHLVEKIQSKNFDKSDAIKLQDLNSYRSQLKNAINEYFQERQEIKV
jgi:hypothetical protein